MGASWNASAGLAGLHWEAGQGRAGLRALPTPMFLKRDPCFVAYPGTPPHIPKQIMVEENDITCLIVWDVALK